MDEEEYYIVTPGKHASVVITVVGSVIKDAPDPVSHLKFKNWDWAQDRFKQWGWSCEKSSSPFFYAG